MATYKIYSMLSGADFGTWYADSPEEALRDMYAEIDVDLDIDTMQYPETRACVDHDVVTVEYALYDADGDTVRGFHGDYTQDGLDVWLVEEVA